MSSSARSAARTPSRLLTTGSSGTRHRFPLDDRCPHCDGRVQRVLSPHLRAPMLLDHRPVAGGMWQIEHKDGERKRAGTYDPTREEMPEAA
jgi:hypothetical protein